MTRDLAVRRIEPAVPRERAELSFRRRRWLLPRPRLLRLELVYAPVYIFECDLELPGDRRTLLRLVVDGIDGEVRRLDRDVSRSAAASDAPPAAESGGAPTGSRDAAELLPARLDALQAVERVNAELGWVLLPAQLRRGRIRAGEPRLVEPAGYPFWVQHVSRGSRRDIEALDALGGSRVGARGRARIVAAIVAARDARAASEGEAAIRPASGP